MTAKIITLALGPDDRVEHGRPSQSARVFAGPVGNVVLIVDASDGKRRSIVLDCRDIDALCGAMQEAASDSRAVWRETVAGFEAGALIERASARA